MEKLTLTTPTVLFIFLSLILLAGAIWFIAYALVDRSITAKFKGNPNLLVLAQIKDVKKRFILTITLQLTGVFCLLLSLVFVYFIFMYLYMLAEIMFGISFGSLFSTGYPHP
ncbi:MAG TPA: DUF2721 domain-containing protein [Bacteroidia bacterium]|nr:DUF2721 domain-containing protein [Bacteroidia bacterium]